MTPNSGAIREALAPLTEALVEELAPLLAPAVAELIEKHDDDPLLTSAQAAEHLGITRDAFYSLKSARKVTPDGANGNRPRYRRSTLDAYLEGRAK